jgi:hypothetical protein
VDGPCGLVAPPAGRAPLRGQADRSPNERRLRGARVSVPGRPREQLALRRRSGRPARRGARAARGRGCRSRACRGGPRPAHRRRASARRAHARRGRARQARGGRRVHHRGTSAGRGRARPDGRHGGRLPRRAACLAGGRHRAPPRGPAGALGRHAGPHEGRPRERRADRLPGRLHRPARGLRVARRGHAAARARLRERDDHGREHLLPVAGDADVGLRHEHRVDDRDRRGGGLLGVRTRPLPRGDPRRRETRGGAARGAPDLRARGHVLGHHRDALARRPLSRRLDDDSLDGGGSDHRRGGLDPRPRSPCSRCS